MIIFMKVSPFGYKFLLYTKRWWVHICHSTLSDEPILKISIISTYDKSAADDVEYFYWKLWKLFKWKFLWAMFSFATIVKRAAELSESVCMWERLNNEIIKLQKLFNKQYVPPIRSSQIAMTSEAALHIVGRCWYSNIFSILYALQMFINCICLIMRQMIR